MWLFNDPPRKLLKEKHNFDVTDAWLDHVQNPRCASTAAAQDHSFPRMDW